MKIQNNKMAKKLLSLFALLLFVGLCVLIYFRVGKPMTELVSDTERFRQWVIDHGWRSRLIFIAMVCFQVVIAIIPGEPLELAAGYVFGPIEGTLLCMAGIFLGSVIVFLLVRLFGRKLVELFFSREKIDSLAILQNPKRLETIVFVLMALPGTPKDLLTYCVGLTNIPIATWLLISTLARIPSIVTSTVGGHFISQRNYPVAIGIFIGTALLCVAGLYYYFKISGKKQEQ